MVFTELGMMTVVSFSHSLNAYSPIPITEFPMVADSKFLHPEKTSLPKVVTEFGMIMVESALSYLFYRVPDGN